MSHPSKSFAALFAFIALFFNHASANQELLFPGRRAAVTAGIPLDQLFPGGLVLPRQGALTCPNAETACADGNGCCPSDAACLSTTTDGTSYGICGGACPIGAATCTAPLKLCCPGLGQTCGADGVCSTGAAASPSTAFQPITSPTASTTSDLFLSSLNSFISSESSFLSDFSVTKNSGASSIASQTTDGLSPGLTNTSPSSTAESTGEGSTTSSQVDQTTTDQATGSEGAAGTSTSEAAGSSAAASGLGEIWTSTTIGMAVAVFGSFALGMIL